MWRNQLGECFLVYTRPPKCYVSFSFRRSPLVDIIVPSFINKGTGDKIWAVCLRIHNQEGGKCFVPRLWALLEGRDGGIYLGTQRDLNHGLNV